MKNSILFLLTVSILCGAATAFTPPDLLVWLAGLALVCGLGGLLLLQRAFFAPARTLEDDIRAATGPGTVGEGSYGALNGLAAACRMREESLARRQQSTHQQDMQERGFVEEEWRERYNLLAASIRMARDSMRLHSRHIQAIGLEIHNDLDSLAGQSRTGGDTSGSGVETLKKRLAECMTAFKSEVDFLDACLAQVNSFPPADGGQSDRSATPVAEPEGEPPFAV
ncbi:MAG: hypothetical protein Q4F27_04315, partial [Desulfovibrionaceae bacterium]|nr:hypothetical protein [Desulfovibrionaceae bacterium]